VAGALVLLLTTSAQIAQAQALGEVAQREAERRTRVAAGRVYTNADLAPEEVSAPSPAPVPGEAAATPGASMPETPAPSASGREPEQVNDSGLDPTIVEAPAKQDEPYWRSKAQNLRDRLAKATAGIAAGEADLRQIAAAPQTPAVAREREVAAATLDRLRRDADSLRDELARLETRPELADAQTQESTR
jgi:hypothetical protein